MYHDPQQRHAGGEQRQQRRVPPAPLHGDVRTPICAARCIVAHVRSPTASTTSASRETPRCSIHAAIPAASSAPPETITRRTTPARSSASPTTSRSASMSDGVPSGNTYAPSTIAASQGLTSATCSKRQPSLAARIARSARAANPVTRPSAPSTRSGADAWTATRAQLDRWHDEWLRMHRDSCEATARGEQSPERLDLRMQCLDRRRQDLRDAGDLAGAHADFQRADSLRSKVLGPDHPSRALALLGLGQVALAQDNPAAALTSLELALRLALASDPDPVDLGQIRFELARALWATGDRPRAIILLGEARAGLLAAGVTGQRPLAELTRWQAEHPA